MDVRVSTRGAEKFDRLAGRFDRAAAELSYRLEDATRGEGDAAVAAVRAAWLGVEVTSTRGGGSSSGLRARVAAATSADPVPGGVRVRVDAGQVDSVYGGSLTRGLNGMGRWRHPVFGNANAWTQQAGQEVFYSTLRGRAWEPPLERVVDETAREIEG
ncbi:MAG: hypothetical protein EPO40_03095 [Myxococcaceae bacterium]|nr:MAG: hypothetical protein EPO40_03095 [Myxococcaceae bacterium]